MTHLINGSFEDGWTDADASTQVPNGWHYEWLTGANPISGDPWNEFVQPEMRVLPREQLPLDERGIFILDGDHTLKLFKGNGAWNARLTQTVILAPGHYRLKVALFADLVKGYDGQKKIWANDSMGRDGMVRFLLNGNPTAWDYVLPPPSDAIQSIYHWRHFKFDFSAGGEAVVGVELMCPFALANSCFFADAWELEQVVTQRGTPREQYERTVNVLPPYATPAQAEAVFRLAWGDGKQTVTGSYDDAGIGDLDTRRAVLWGIDEAEKANFVSFFEHYYPDVTVVFRSFL
jgi:hypothetical protein